MSGEPPGGTGAGWAWVDHLRAGGTTPWAAYDARAAAASDDRSPGSGPAGGTGPAGVLPGAAQLEVLRRLNERQDAALPADLVDRVLGSSGPGRGQPERSLRGVGDGTRFGPRPADPGRLGTAELIRVTVGVLAELALAVPPQAGIEAVAVRVPWRRDHRLLGDPVLADGVRRALDAAGHRRGLRPPVALVLGRDLGTLLAEVWRWRVTQGATPTWRWWVAHWARRDELPPRADLAALAGQWAERVGAGHVHVVLGPDPAADAGRLVGHRGALVAPYASLVPAPDGLEVLRRANAALRVMVSPERHRAVLDEVLLPAVCAHAGPAGDAPAVPEEQRDWVRGRAERLRAEVLAGGYPVHGDPDALLPAFGGRPGTATPEAVLDVALRTLLTVKEADR